VDVEPVPAPPSHHRIVEAIMLVFAVAPAPTTVVDLAETTGYAVKTIRNALDQARADGLIEVCGSQRPTDPAARGRWPNLYRPVVPDSER
jgi:hypothetical protein